MESKHDLYHAGNVTPVGAAEPKRHPSGLLYAKVLQTKAQDDSQATITRTRSNLIALDQYMANLSDLDVKIFNENVRRQLQTLTARDETMNDLILHLFQGYMMVQCSPFIDYIMQKEEGYMADGVDFVVFNFIFMSVVGEHMVGFMAVVLGHEVI
jgi:hypothetical protein